MVKFGTYMQDSFTGLDYADQRFYASSYGRFNTADPYQASAGAGDPGSWNRYSYVVGDPVNRVDPTGRVWCDPNAPGCDADQPTRYSALSAEQPDQGREYTSIECSITMKYRPVAQHTKYSYPGTLHLKRMSSFFPRSQRR